MSDETPTERFASPEPSGDGDPRAKKSKLLIVILSIVGGLLLIVIVILLMLLFSRGSGGTSDDLVANPTTSPTQSALPSQSPSATPSPSPSASPSDASSPPPQATGPRFTQFTFPSSQRCSAAAPGFPATRPTFTVSWSTAGADEAWFINGTDDAKDSGFMQIPLNGDQADFPYEQTVDCADDSNVYTITLVGPDGKHVSKSWTVAITGDNF